MNERKPYSDLLNAALEPEYPELNHVALQLLKRLIDEGFTDHVVQEIDLSLLVNLPVQSDRSEVQELSRRIIHRLIHEGYVDQISQQANILLHAKNGLRQDDPRLLNLIAKVIETLIAEGYAELIIQEFDLTSLIEQTINQSNSESGHLYMNLLEMLITRGYSDFIIKEIEQSVLHDKDLKIENPRLKRLLQLAIKESIPTELSDSQAQQKKNIFPNQLNRQIRLLREFFGDQYVSEVADQVNLSLLLGAVFENESELAQEAFTDLIDAGYANELITNSQLHDIVPAGDKRGQKSDRRFSEHLKALFESADTHVLLENIDFDHLFEILSLEGYDTVCKVVFDQNWIDDVTKGLVDEDPQVQALGVYAAALVVEARPEMGGNFKSGLFYVLQQDQTPSVFATAIRTLVTIELSTEASIASHDSLFGYLIKENNGFVQEELVANLSVVVIERPEEYADTISAFQDVLIGTNVTVRLTAVKTLAIIAQRKPGLVSQTDLVAEFKNLKNDAQFPVAEINQAIEIVQEAGGNTGTSCG